MKHDRHTAFALFAVLWLFAWGCQLGLDGSDDDTVNGGDDDTSGADDDQGGDDDSTPVGAVTVSAVSPNVGAIDGGYPAKIYGANFTDAADTVVYFGLAFATVTSCSEGQCEVTVPPGTETGPVTVTLENSLGTGVKEEAFTYEEDVSGLVTYTAEVMRFEHLYPEAYGDPAPESTVYATSYFFTPMEIDAYMQLSWGHLLPAMGACVTYSMLTDFQTTSLSPYDAGDSVTLTNGGAELTLEKTYHYYSTSTTDLTSYQPGVYALDLPGGDDLYPETLSSAVQAPGVVLTQPPMDPSTVSPSSLSSGLQVGIQGGCSPAVVNLHVYDVDEYYWESVLCHFSSGQGMTVPGSYVSGYSSALAFVVEPECYVITESVAASGARVVGIGRSVASGVMYIQ